MPFLLRGADVYTQFCVWRKGKGERHTSQSTPSARSNPPCLSHELMLVLICTAVPCSSQLLQKRGMMVSPHHAWSNPLCLGIELVLVLMCSASCAVQL